MVQSALEAEMTNFLGALRSERTGKRRGYRSRYESLAKQCGTSVAMLEKYYDKVQPEDEAAVLVNDPIDALALIDIGTDPDPTAAKTDLTLGRDGLLAIRP
jgi:hypothetical protein